MHLFVKKIGLCNFAKQYYGLFIAQCKAGLIILSVSSIKRVEHKNCVTYPNFYGCGSRITESKVYASKLKCCTNLSYHTITIRMQPLVLSVLVMN